MSLLISQLLLGLRLKVIVLTEVERRILTLRRKVAKGLEVVALRLQLLGEVQGLVMLEDNVHILVQVESVLLLLRENLIRIIVITVNLVRVQSCM